MKSGNTASNQGAISISLTSKLLSRLPIDGTKPQEVATIKMAVKLPGTPKTWASSLSGVGLSKISVKKESLSASLIQSVGIRQNPHQYISLIFSKNLIEAHYTISSPYSSAKRHLEVLRLILLCLGAIGPVSLTPQLSNAISKSLQDSISLLCAGMPELMAKNSELQKTSEEQGERIAGLYDERERMARRALEDARRLQSLSSKLEALMLIPDSSLDESVFEWLLSHGGQISIGEFCSAHNVLASRAELSLDRLCKAGKIARVQK